MRRAIRELLLLLLIAAVPALLAGWWHPRRPAFNEETIPALSAKAARDLARDQPVLWIDARRAAVFAADHIPGAVHLSEDDWEGGLSAVMEVWNPGQPVIVYCDQRTCDASRDVATRLKRELQMKHVYVLEGGWSSWQQTR